MKHFLALFVISIALLSCKPAPTDTSNLEIDATYLKARLNLLSKKMENHLQNFPVDSLKIPRAINNEGNLIAKTSREWTSGFFPGTLWQLAAISKSPKLIDQARRWSSFVEKEKWDTHTHDLGFKVNSAFGQWNKVEYKKKNDDIIVQASKTLIRRYDENIGAIKSWDFGKDRWQYPVIIDNMMNLEMLFDATDITGDSIYYNIAKRHAETTLKNHFRKDNSSYHVIDYDTITGQVRNRLTHQGLTDESDWARGQAWGMYGFAMAYDRTGDKAFLDQANGIAAFFFNHPNMPEDLIPYWDFDAKNIPNEPKDVSAAAVAACALLKLAKHSPDKSDTYMKWVDTIIAALDTEEYQTEKIPFLLGRSTGSVPDNFEINAPISYGDYYYVQALIERLKMEQ